MKKIRGGIVCFSLAILFGTVEAAPPQLPFSLVVREGFGSIAVGDINTTLISINSGYDIVRSSSPSWGCTGEIKPIPHRYKDWEFELQWDFLWGFGMGIAISAPTDYSGSSFLTFSIMQDGLNQTENNTYASHIRVSAPVKVYLHKSFVLLRDISATFSGGLGFYNARLTQSYLYQVRNPLEDQFITNLIFNVQGRHSGSNIGIGLEYRLNKKFALSATWQWQFIKIESLKGSALLETQRFDAAGNLTSVDRTLIDGTFYHYIGQDFSTGRMREKLVVENLDPPWYGIDMPTDIRRAFLDLSGFTLRIGLKIGLF